MRINIKFLILVVLTLFFVLQLPAQVIRKNYREMTTAEKQILVNALIALGPRTTTGTVVNNYATNHEQIFSTTIHRDNDFLPWHRWFILHFEKALQNAPVIGASKIALPYWDWTSQYYTTAPTDQSKLSPLWDNSFLGQFNTMAGWNLGRVSSSSTVLGTTFQLGQVIITSNFSQFRTQIEDPPFHDSGHVWVGGSTGTVGIMSQRNSPGDPVFYLHHNMIDKVWQDWHNLGRTSSFTEENMPNTLPAGTTSFPIGVPTTTPSSIIDGRASSVKVWFAENGKVILDKYTVNGNEKYYYTGVLEAGTRLIPTKNINGTIISYTTGPFTVPSGTTCNFVSGGLQMGSSPEAGFIRLVPGFAALAGSNFSAKINSVYFTDAGSSGRLATSETQIAEEKSKGRDEDIIVFPNPSKGEFYVTLPKENESYNYEVVNPFGAVILKGNLDSNPSLIDLSGVKSGIYLLKIIDSLGKSFSTRLIIQ